VSGLRIERDGPGGVVARVTLARPEVRNAFNAELIRDLRSTFDELSREAPERLRAVVIAGEGPLFSAGADVEWMRAALELDLAANEADASRMQAMFGAIDSCPAPVVARVQGAALGGGVGLCAVADIVLATADAVFGFTEVKLGIIPAVISPFVLAKIGESNARALFPGGQRFGAERARDIGLVHEILDDEKELDARLAEVLDDLLSAGPSASRAAKALVGELRRLSPEEARRHTVRHIAQQRTSDEGQEGLTAFVEKRLPSWRRHQT
jgi:methylglutaconyl-CoA hydratase